MALSFFARALLLASALPHANLVGAQTVTQNGEVIRKRSSLSSLLPVMLMQLHSC